MADPTQLQGQIFQTFGQGLTGIDYNSISSGIEKDRDFKRKELDSLYDVGAELDANAFRALQGELGGIYDKIESNDLIAGTPEFRAAQRRLTSIATDLKQTQDLTQSVLRDASSNPQNVSYIVEDEEGNPIDLGYSGLIDAARSFGGEKFGRPEDYLGAGSQFLSKIGERIDENDLRRSVQQSVEADVKRAFEEIGLDGSELDTKMDNYRSGLVDLRKELGEESFNAIRDNNKQRYQEGIRSKYAIDKNRNAVEKGKNVDDYATEYVEGFIPRAKSDVSRFTVPEPKNDEDKKILTGIGNGRWENDKFTFVMVDEPTAREKRSLRGRRKGFGGKLNVQSKGTSEPLRSFTSNEDGDKIAGRLTDIEFKGGQPILIIRTANDDFEEFPIGENFAVLEEFYGITEQQIKDMLQGFSEGERRVSNQNSNPLGLDL